MCGISGLFDIEGINDFIHDFYRANEIVKHRGPDGHAIALFQVATQKACKVYISENVPGLGLKQDINLALGHQRLAIIDLSANGAQPMPSADGTLWITYNGEVYNYIELREELKKLGHRFRSESDTEVILEAYAEWGEDCVTRFNGIWAFAIADLNRRKLFCSRDRFGVKPFHYYYDGHRFAFGSEIKQLLCYSFVPKKMDERAVYEYLAFGAVDYGEETFFSSIQKLMQGYNLTVNLIDGSMAKSCYYQPLFQKNNDITYKEAALEFCRLLTDSVRLQLRSDVEVGSCLSGGLDSTSIVCLMRRELERTGKAHIQRTFSSHFDDEEADELEYMQEAIQATGVHSEFIYPSGDDLLNDLKRVVWHQEEPFGSTSIFAQWSVFKLVNQHGVKVMLDGQGSDEMLAGYVGLFPYYFKQLKARRQSLRFLIETGKYAHLHDHPWPPLIGGKLGQVLGKFHKRPIQPAFSYRSDWLSNDFSQAYKDQAVYPQTTQIKPFGESAHLENMLFQMTFVNNLQSLLRHEDRNSMAFSIEARVPFLDHRLVEFAFSLPSRFKIRDGYTKRVLRDGMKGILPEKIRWRVKKLGFATPERKWRRTILKPLIEEAIQDGRLRRYIVKENASTYFRQLQESDVAEFAPWRWLNLSLWMDVYDFR